MRKKLGLLIALAISLSISSTSLAAAVGSTDTSSTATTSSSVTSTNPSVLTLDQVLKNVEVSNIDLQAIDKKIDGLNKQYDNDKRKAISIDASGKSSSQYPNGQYAQIVMQQQVTPVQDQQSIDDQKNTKDEKTNSIKFDLQKQYMNAITAQNQIDNINKNIADIDEQIKQTEAKISLGQVTQDTVNPLMVQKSKLLSQLATPTTQLQQSLFNVKKYLNMDLTSNVSLSPAKKDYVKFDDTDIATKINEAVQKDYASNSLQKNIDIEKTVVDIYTKYAYDSLTQPANSKLDLLNLQNQLVDNNNTLVLNLWKAYYAVKNKEDTVQAQQVAQESAQLSYNKAKQSYDNGLIDKVSLDSAELALSTQKVATQQAINDYMVTQEQFKYALNGHASTASSIK